MSRGGLPVAEPTEVRRAAVALVKADGRAFAAVLALNSLAAPAGLAGPWLLARIIDGVRDGGGVSVVDRLAPVILLCAPAVAAGRAPGHPAHPTTHTPTRSYTEPGLPHNERLSAKFLTRS
ncbi:hypothetical protein SHIRM173S_03831 [Streptomyces hirsutus]